MYSEQTFEMNFTYEINLTTQKIMHLVTHLNVRTSRTKEGRERLEYLSPRKCVTREYKQLKRASHLSAHGGLVERNKHEEKKPQECRRMPGKMEENNSLPESLRKSLKYFIISCNFSNQ